MVVAVAAMAAAVEDILAAVAAECTSAVAAAECISAVVAAECISAAVAAECILAAVADYIWAAVGLVVLTLVAATSPAHTSAGRILEQPILAGRPWHARCLRRQVSIRAAAMLAQAWEPPAVYTPGTPIFTTDMAAFGTASTMTPIRIAMTTRAGRLTACT